MNFRTLNFTIVKTITMKLFPVLLLWMAGTAVKAQTFEVYIANEQLTSNTQMEFDVYIRSTGATSDWPLRSYQCGYQFSSAFVNGGTLSGQYVAGSTDLTESTFGKTWAFSWNTANNVLNQSANTGNSCPGAAIGSTPRKIGRFRVTNTVTWGCADDAITIKSSGSGFLLLAVTKWNTLDCSDPGTTTVTSGGTAYTSSPNASLLSATATAASASTSCGNNVDVTVAASGGVAPYSGTGTFSKAAGTWSFTVTDARGCSVTTNSVTISTGTGATTSSTTASGCLTYTWNGNTYTQSGTYSYLTTNASGCDSTAYLVLTINSETPNVSTVSSCDSYTWANTGTTYTQSGTYTGTATNCVREILNLTIVTSSYNTTTAASCDTYTWANTGLTYTQTGVYTGSVSNCVTALLDLTINSSASGTAGTISGPSGVCPGLTIQLTTNGTAGGTWSSSNPADVSVGASTGVVTGITPDASAVITYTVNDGCGVPVSATTTVTVVSSYNVSSTIEGDKTVCEYMGTSPYNVTYTIATSAPGIYHWYVPAGATIISGQGTDAITLHFASTFQTGNLSVSVVAQCIDTAIIRTEKLSRGYAPNQPVAINGPKNVCDYLGNGQPAVYIVTPVANAAHYIWTLPQYCTMLSANADSSRIEVLFAAAFSTLGSTRKQLKVKAYSGCGTSDNKIMSLTTYVPATIASGILGPSNLCMIMNGDFATGKDTFYYCSRSDGASTYLWTVPNGITILEHPSGLGALDTIIKVRVTSAFTTGSITVKGVNGCGASSTKSLTLSKILPVKPGTVYPVVISSACPNQRVYYYLNAYPKNSRYLVWQAPAGAVIDSVSANQLRCYVTYPGKGSSYTGVVKVWGVNGCGAGQFASRTVSISACAPAFAANMPDQDNTATAGLDLRVFPNPSVNNFHLQALSGDLNSKMEVRVTDLQGRKLNQYFMMPGETLNFGSELRSGAYMIQVLQGTKAKTVRVVKL